MPIDGSSGFEQDLARSSCPAAPASGFNANLRLTPQSPGEYRVVLTFHHCDGQLGEAAHSPESLLSEIAHVHEAGDRRASRSKSESDLT
jgi:hypothetical protein